MKKSILFIGVAIVINFIWFSFVSAASVCDQSFNGGMLRDNKTYQFYDEWNNNGTATDYMNNYWVSYKETGTWNEGPSSTWSYLDPWSDFDWTQTLKNTGYWVPGNSRMRIVDTGPTNWRIKKHPTSRTQGTVSSYDFALRYKVSYDNSNNYPDTSDDKIHTECVYYSVTWCGDGVRDLGYEICDPNDPSQTWWGNGGCNNICEPITINPPTTCDSITVSPLTWEAPFTTNVSCSASNATTYEIQCGNGKVINSQTGICSYPVGSDYTARCIVDGNITSNACTQTVRVTNPTPSIRIDKVDANPSDIDTNIGNDTQTVLQGNKAVFKIRVTNVGNESLKELQVIDALAPTCAGIVSLPWVYPTTWSNFSIWGWGDHGNNILEIWEWYEYLCEKWNTQNNYTNEAITQWKWIISGVLVSDYNRTEVKLVSPKIQVIKVDKNPSDLDIIQGNDTQTVSIGSGAIFSITVQNIGTEDLKNITLVDAQANACASQDGSFVNLQTNSFVNKDGVNIDIITSGAGDHTDNIFQINELFTYTCSKSNTQSNYTNTVNTTAVGITSWISVTDTDSTEVRVKNITSACTGLTASPTSAQNTLTSTLTCTGNAATSYKIEVKNSAGTVIDTINAATGNVTLNAIDTYTASCYVNGETTTPAICEQTLSVTNPGGGTEPHCTDIIQENADTIRCYGNFKVQSFYMTCGVDADGNTITLPTKVALQEGTTSRYYADFNCSSTQAQCYAYKSDIPVGDTRWDTGAKCTLDTPISCGNGVVEAGEQCDLWDNNGKAWYACSATCTLWGGWPDYCGDGKIQWTETCDFGSPKTSSAWGSCYLPGTKIDGKSVECTTPTCTKENGCILTWPDGGDLIFGPVGDVIIWHGQNPLTIKGQLPYLYNNSDYDLSFDKLCIKRTDGSTVLTSSENDGGVDGQSCINIGNNMIYPYETIYFSDYKTTTPNYIWEKSGIPGNKSYGKAKLTTSIIDDGVSYYNSYLSADLNVRVAKPTISTIGGGTSYIKDASKTGDVEKITAWVSGFTNNKNFVGTSVNSKGISSYADEVTDTNAISQTQKDRTKYDNSVNTLSSSINTWVSITNKSGFDKFTSYNGLSNVFIIRDTNITLADLPTLTQATTYIIEWGNLKLTKDIITHQNIAFVVKGWNIIIDKDVKYLDGTYISIPGESTWGKITWNGETNVQLLVKGSLYGDTSELVNDRYYIANSTSGGLLSVGTIVSFGSSLFYKPAPLVGQFIGEYLWSTKVAK